MSTHNIGFYEEIKQNYHLIIIKAILMNTHNIGFYEEIKQNYHLIIIKYHQIRTLFLLLNCYQGPYPPDPPTLTIL